MMPAEQYEAHAQRLLALEAEIARLGAEVHVVRTWTESWPAERERTTIIVLMRAELDLYREKAEAALTGVAERVHEDLSALKGGMTAGAADAIADVRTKIQLVVDMHKRAQTGQAGIISRLDTMATAQAQGATFDAGVERLVETYRDLWAAQKAEAEAARAALLARERARAAKQARQYRFGQSVAVPILMYSIGTPIALVMGLSGTLPPHVVAGIAAAMFTAGCLFSFYWGVLRSPPPAEIVEAAPSPPTAPTAPHQQDEGKA